MDLDVERVIFDENIIFYPILLCSLSTVIYVVRIRVAYVNNGVLDITIYNIV
jgi:hypothetical protein